ncbi:hypothetical protein N3K66_008005 [Trichothecium roseum]|uniref:Uncharacterized protein n=1 Tax=Trichothecium roseum TaxID=47278 RepID=A0ACC0USA7_9HYPO|nr:hypothetical protein N3K66_008005 [Trichothecium roseum]
MPSSSEMRSHRDSWPPTQVRLVPVDMQVGKAADELRPLLDIDDDPLTYFLTPTPDFEDVDGDFDMDMGFDAGIEDPSRPRDVVRSVSPSTLDGLRKTRTRGLLRRMPSSDMITESGLATPPDEDDDDNEEYVGFSPQFLSLSDFSDSRPQNPVFGRSVNSRLSPPPQLSMSPPQSSSPPPLSSSPLSRGRTRSGRNRLGGSRARGGRPAHLWREPSPDVWSIEEETEEEILSGELSDDPAGSWGSPRREGIEMRAASKPKKQVRFVLPAGHA